MASWHCNSHRADESGWNMNLREATDEEIREEIKVLEARLKQLKDELLYRKQNELGQAGYWRTPWGTVPK